MARSLALLPFLAGVRPGNFTGIRRDVKTDATEIQQSSIALEVHSSVFLSKTNIVLISYPSDFGTPHRRDDRDNFRH